MFPYVGSIVWPKTPEERTTPNRVSYFIWCGLSIINYFAYKASGEKETLWLPFIGIFTSGTIFLLSFKWGEKVWYPVDKYCLGLGLLALVGWWFVGALAAIIIIVVADALAVIPTVAKIVRNPFSENIPGWSCGLFAAIANIFAIKDLTWANGIYNGYMLCSFLSILIPLIYGRYQRRLQGASP